MGLLLIGCSWPMHYCNQTNKNGTKVDVGSLYGQRADKWKPDRTHQLKRRDRIATIKSLNPKMIAYIRGIYINYTSIDLTTTKCM